MRTELVVGGLALVIAAAAAVVRLRRVMASRGWPTWLVVSGVILCVAAGAALSVIARRHR